MRSTAPQPIHSRILTGALVLGLLIHGPAHATGSRGTKASCPDGKVWAIEHVAVIPMDQERVLKDHTVVVRGDRILSVALTSRATVPDGATRIDGRGKYLIPGLVDMHIHLAQGPGAVGDPAGRQLRLLLANGITTARVLIPSPTALDVRDRIARGDQLGPRLVVYSTSMNGSNVSTPEQATKLVDQYADQGYEGIKTHGGIPLPAYDAMMEAAARRKLPVAGHVTSDVGLTRALEAKQQIEHLDGYLQALVPESSSIPAPEGQFLLEDTELRAIDETRIPGVIQATREAGIANGPTLALFSMLVSEESVNALAARPEMRYVPKQVVSGWSQQVAAFPGRAVAVENRRRFVELRQRLVRDLDKAGCPILASSDSPQIFMVPGFALHREMEAMVAAGLRPYAALLAATRSPHRYLGHTDAGTIAPGMRADLVLLDGNPLDDIGNSARVGGVLAGGRWQSKDEIRRLFDDVERSARDAG